MTKRVAFTAAEIAAVEKAARSGVRLAMIVRPDGTKIIAPAANIDIPTDDADLDARMDAFATGGRR